MTKKQKLTDIKLQERCQILEKILIALSPVYFHDETNDNQRRLIETTIGAAIFYLPQGEKYWTGKISRAALDSLQLNPKATLTKEHEYPRKIAAKELIHFFRTHTLEVSLHKLYEEKYGKYNLVTPVENKRVSHFQRDGRFETIEEAYRLAGIELVLITGEELFGLKKRDLPFVSPQ